MADSTRRGTIPTCSIGAGIRAAIDYTASPFEILSGGGGIPYQPGEIVRSLEQTCGVRAKLEFHPRSEGDVRRTAADITKARELLGYEPVTGLAAGLAAFADWLEGHVSAFPTALEALA